jgi:hypothetical protein
VSRLCQSAVVVAGADLGARDTIIIIIIIIIIIFYFLFFFFFGSDYAAAIFLATICTPLSMHEKLHYHAHSGGFPLGPPKNLLGDSKRTKNGVPGPSR